MSVLRSTSLATLFFLSACGGGEPRESRTANDAEAEHEGPAGSTLQASAEIGALDEHKVTETFRDAQADLQRCVEEGASRIEYLGGDVAFFVRVDGRGRAIHAHLERSTLGDRATERCMLAALARRSWPEPQGGENGLARTSFGFDMPNDVRPPTDWDGSRVSEVVEGPSSEIAACKRGTRGDFTATVYVDPDGKALGAGIAVSDETGAQAADCLARVLTEAQYPSPGSWTAKVTFPL